MRGELFKQFYVNSAQHKDIDPNVWLLNYVIDRMEMNEQQVLWLCFLNAITYHAPTALLSVQVLRDWKSGGRKTFNCAYLSKQTNLNNAGTYLKQLNHTKLWLAVIR